MNVPSEQNTPSIADAKSGPETSSPRPCRLLSLAPELRNEIYELAFTCNDAKIDLATAVPPSSALLRCCRQIHCEAIEIFKDSVRQYYTESYFHLDLEVQRKGDGPYATFDKVAKVHDIDSVRNIQFTYEDRINDYFYKAISQQNGLVWDLERYDYYDWAGSLHVLLLSEGDQSFR
ncbi:hypothetical protein HII31_10251 [Pseudocercospora fuligena]|uniref:Uncharacterized protein n=1 Tax=Pseudocercospora fuligena TaxID=685502 RepID=A0A8H6RBJ9_9PEZI|nr:hypothetical protein HII31_10251 [Pseudocercospora fuligena]